MAIVVTLNNKSQSCKGLAELLKYVSRGYKTNLKSGQKLVSGINCSPDTAYNEFMLTKQLHKKTNGRYFYHYCQSFSPTENVSPETVHEIGLELAKKVFSGYETIVGTHIEKGHLHNHIVVNSVNSENGKKLHQDKKSLDSIRNISDKICLEYGLNVLPNKKRTTAKNMSHREYSAAVKGESWKFKLINTIETAMDLCESKAEFILYMKSEGYEVSWTNSRKYICYTTPTGKKCRDIRLHEDKFLKENMENEFKFRKIERTKPTDAECGFDTDYRANETIGDEIGQTANSKSGRDDEEIKFTFRTGWESSRRNLRENRKRLKEDLHQDFSSDDSCNNFNNINYCNFKRVLSLVKSFQRLGKRRGFDEDDTLAVAMMTGLTASTVTILIEILSNIPDNELSEMFAEESAEKNNEEIETEFGEIKM